MSIKSILFATSILLLCPISPASNAGEVQGKCKPPRAVAFKTSDAISETGSTTFENVPDAGINFIGSSTPNCVFVRFSAITGPPCCAYGEVQVVLDGGAVALPGSVLLIPPYVDYPTPRSFEFVFPEVGPNRHNVQVQWRKFDPGNFIQLQARTLVVSY
jgi:hypothetical protein